MAKFVFGPLFLFSIGAIILGFYVWKNKTMISILGKKKIDKKDLPEYSKYASDTYLMMGAIVLPESFSVCTDQWPDYLSIALFIVGVFIIIYNQIQAKKKFGCGVGIL